MTAIRKNIALSGLATARLTAEAKRKGMSESAVLANLIMHHLPATRMDHEAEAMLNAAMGTVKMPSNWGEAPSWLKQ